PRAVLSCSPSRSDLRLNSATPTRCSSIQRLMYPPIDSEGCPLVIEVSIRTRTVLSSGRRSRRSSSINDITRRAGRDASGSGSLPPIAAPPLEPSQHQAREHRSNPADFHYDVHIRRREP